MYIRLATAYIKILKLVIKRNNAVLRVENKITSNGLQNNYSPSSTFNIYYLIGILA